MIDLTYSFDFQVINNETIEIGIVHLFNQKMISSKYKDVIFQVKKKKLGTKYNNFKIV